MRKYNCAMHCFLEEEDDLRLDIEVPVAHPFNTKEGTKTSIAVGLWGKVSVSVRFNKFMWLEDLIVIVETVISKESSEGQQTTVAEKPMESLLENLANRFDELTELKWYSISVENISQGYSLFATLSSANES
jgi:GTP cyclohydrolase I